MRSTSKLTTVVLAFLALTATAHGQSSRQQFQSAVAAYQQSATEDNARKLAEISKQLEPPPAVPEEAEFRGLKGAAFIKQGGVATAFVKAAVEFRAAIAAAPWVGEYHYNLAVCEKSAGRLLAAQTALKFAQIFARGDKERRDGLILRAELEATQELGAARTVAEQDGASAKALADHLPAPDVAVPKVIGVPTAPRDPTTLDSSELKEPGADRLGKYLAVTSTAAPFTDLESKKPKRPIVGSVMYSLDGTMSPVTFKAGTRLAFVMRWGVTLQKMKQDPPRLERLAVKDGKRYSTNAYILLDARPYGTPTVSVVAREAGVTMYSYLLVPQQELPAGQYSISDPFSIGFDLPVAAFAIVERGIAETLNAVPSTRGTDVRNSTSGTEPRRTDGGLGFNAARGILGPARAGSPDNSSGMTVVEARFALRKTLAVMARSDSPSDCNDFKVHSMSPLQEIVITPDGFQFTAKGHYRGEAYGRWTVQWTQGDPFEVYPQFSFVKMNQISVRECKGQFGIVLAGTKKSLNPSINSWARISDAQLFADAVNMLITEARHFDPARETAEFESFKATAKVWRDLTVKPELPEESRRERILAEEAFGNKDLLGAMYHYDAGLRLTPLWPQGLFNAAFLAGEFGDYSAAVRHMKRYLELVPDATDAQAGRNRLIIWQDKAQQRQR